MHSIKPMDPPTPPTKLRQKNSPALKHKHEPQQGVGTRLDKSSTWTSDVTNIRPPACSPASQTEWHASLFSVFTWWNQTQTKMCLTWRKWTSRQDCRYFRHKELLERQPQGTATSNNVFAKQSGSQTNIMVTFIFSHAAATTRSNSRIEHSLLPTLNGCCSWTVCRTYWANAPSLPQARILA